MTNNYKAIFHVNVTFANGVVMHDRGVRLYDQPTPPSELQQRILNEYARSEGQAVTAHKWLKFDIPAQGYSLKPE